MTNGHERAERFRRPDVITPRARDASHAVLLARATEPDSLVLLPSYVGWSPREGSGVSDPVPASGLPYAFYRLDRDLRIDLAELTKALDLPHARLLVLVHYFGWVDPAAETAIRLARSRGLHVLEDCAHAMLTDLVGGACGRDGDSAVYSLHKLLPFATGGMLVSNADADLLERAPQGPAGVGAPWEYDLHRVAAARCENADRLHDLLDAEDWGGEPLWGPPPPNQVPQTYPVRLRFASRDKVYAQMNAAGYGVVSLYHTMIQEIPHEQFAESHALSKEILNLPVHQDLSPSQIPAMVEVLRDCANRLSE